MLRIFRKNKKKPGAVQDVQLRPAERSGQDPLEQRLEDTRRQLGKRLSSLLTGRSSIDEDLLAGGVHASAQFHNDLSIHFDAAFPNQLLALPPAADTSRSKHLLQALQTTRVAGVWCDGGLLAIRFARGHGFTEGGRREREPVRSS